MKIVTDLTKLDYGLDYDKQYIAADKYFITCHTGYSGSDLREFVELTEPMSVLEWDARLWEMAVSNAESYGIYVEDDETEHDEDDDSQYSSNIEGSAVNYNSDEHDMYSMTGRPGFEQW